MNTELTYEDALILSHSTMLRGPGNQTLRNAYHDADCNDASIMLEAQQLQCGFVLTDKNETVFTRAG